MPFQSKELFSMASMKSPLGQWLVHWRWPWNPARMALCPRASSPQIEFGQAWIANQHIPGDQGHLDHRLPILVFQETTGVVFRAGCIHGLPGNWLSSRPGHASNSSGS